MARKRRIFAASREVKLPPHPQMEAVKVTWVCTCGWRQETVGPTIRASGGGCSGHGEGEYCYCPSAEAFICVHCIKCSAYHEFSF